MGWGQVSCALLATRLEPGPRNVSWVSQSPSKPLPGRVTQLPSSVSVQGGRERQSKLRAAPLGCSSQNTSTAKAALGDCQAEPATVELIQPAASAAPLCCPSHLSLPVSEDFGGGTFAGCLEVLY